MVINDHDIVNKDLHQVMLGGYIQLLYSIIESRFRIFTRAIDPEACVSKELINSTRYTIGCWIDRIKVNSHT